MVGQVEHLAVAGDHDEPVEGGEERAVVADGDDGGVVKPFEIEFTAFGTHPGEATVDSRALVARAQFVVTGEAGTDEATTVDAMNDALFGEMPLKPGHDIRSHHADSTQVTLTWADSSNSRCPPGYIEAGPGFTTPAALEVAHDRQQRSADPAETQTSEPPCDPGGAQACSSIKR